MSSIMRCLSAVMAKLLRENGMCWQAAFPWFRKRTRKEIERERATRRGRRKDLDAKSYTAQRFSSTGKMCSSTFYWGKPAVRNFRGGNGNVGSIRSPISAIALPDWRYNANYDDEAGASPPSTKGVRSLHLFLVLHIGRCLTGVACAALPLIGIMACAYGVGHMRYGFVGSASAESGSPRSFTAAPTIMICGPVTTQ